MGHGIVATIHRKGVLNEIIRSEFEKLYGADGDWTKLSRRSRSFLGSSFLRDIVAETRYLLVEYWSEMLIYEQHRTSRSAMIDAIETRRAELVDAMEPLGIYALAPGVMAAVLPYTLLAACPISMLLMMKSMHGEQGTPHETGDAPTPEVRLARLKAQYAALDEKIGALERDEGQQTYRERRARRQ